jgi:hypothetical protein
MATVMVASSYRTGKTHLSGADCFRIARQKVKRRLVEIWVQLGSINSSCEFLAMPKMAASAVECQSGTGRVGLDTAEGWGSRPHAPPFSPKYFRNVTLTFWTL